MTCAYLPWIVYWFLLIHYGIDLGGQVVKITFILFLQLYLYQFHLVLSEEKRDISFNVGCNISVPVNNDI